MSYEHGGAGSGARYAPRETEPPAQSSTPTTPSYRLPTYAQPRYSRPDYASPSYSVPSLYSEADTDRVPEAIAPHEPPVPHSLVQGRPARVAVDRVPSSAGGPEQFPLVPYLGQVFAPTVTSSDVRADPTPAAYGMRLLARLIDLVVFGTTAVVLGLGVRDALRLVTDPLGSHHFSLDGGSVGFLCSLVFLNEVVLVVTLGGQLGKLVTGLRIADQGTGAVPVRPGVALGRWLLLAVAWAMGFFPGLLFGLSPLFRTPSRQGWHDRIVRTIVVKNS